MIGVKSNFSVVIISYNGWEFLLRALSALSRSSAKPLEIIVVDDHSNDRTSELLAEQFPSVKVIRNSKNIGPTASRNRGAAAAQGEYIVFLDNDLLVRPTTISILLECAVRNPRCGVVGPKIIPEGKEKMWWNIGYDSNNFRESAGYFFGFLLRRFPSSGMLKRLSTLFILNYWNMDKTRAVDWVVEPCFAISKRVFDSVNGFDEGYFMFFEGPDLCYRIRQRGLQIYFCPESKADLLEGHAHISDSVDKWAKRRKIFHLSKEHFYRKHYYYLKSNPLLFRLGNALSRLMFKLA